jgi:hypothetical protein
MAENLSIESPDFGRIRKGDDRAVEDAIRLLWFVSNNEITERRRGVRAARDRYRPRLKVSSPTVQQDNFDLEGVGLLRLDGSTNVTFTGLRAQEEGDVLIIHNIGSATYTFAHESGSSDAQNRIVFQAAANKSVATNRSLILAYLNTRWREISLA